ncbi:hypothetical protein HK098_005930 [Nowakowskiella sp. JEL0407]|nr:hypothetical protein HK098_005930 [Nowakowskiella sp. JEL0407]
MFVAQSLIEAHSEFIEKSRSNELFKSLNIAALSDVDIARFLVVCKGKEDAALKRIEATLNWRKSFDIEKLMSEDFSEIESTCKLKVCGPTKSGLPILVWSAARHRPTDFPMEQNIRYFVQVIEKGKRSGVFKEPLVFINDRTGMKRSNMDPKLMRNIVILFSAHYPETLEVAFNFPSGKLLTVGWNVIKTLISPANAQKMQFLSEKEFRAQILELVEPENLTKRLGGFIPDDMANLSKVSLLDPKEDVNADEIDEKIVAELVKELGDVDADSK